MEIFPPQPIIPEGSLEQYAKYVTWLRTDLGLSPEWNNFLINSIIENNGNFTQIVNFVAVEFDNKRKRSFSGKGLNDPYYEIVEYENDLIYIPSGSNCFYKSILYLCNNVLIDYMKKNITNYTDGKEIKRLRLWGIVGILTWDFKKNYWVKRKNWPVCYNNIGFFIFVFNGVKQAHYISFKNNIKLSYDQIFRYMRVVKKNPTWESFHLYKRMTDLYPKEFEDSVIVADIEAAPEIKNDMLHREYMLGYSLVKFNMDHYDYNYVVSSNRLYIVLSIR